jgi:nucleoside-diphosphate-sugar epimerase
MTVLLTGAAGFLGRAIVRAFTRDGIEVLATDEADESAFVPRPGTDTGRVTYVRRDLEHESLADLVARASGVVYAAALTPADETEGDVAERLLAVNLSGFLDVLGAMRTARECRRMLFVSSTSVYDQTADTTLDEDDLSPTGGLYGAAKLAAESVGRQYAEIIGREFCAVRPTTLIGPGERWRASRPRLSALARLIEASREGRPVRLANGSAAEDVLSVDDAADSVTALWRRLPSWNGRSFSVSAGTLHSVADIAQAVQVVAGLEFDDAGILIEGGYDLPAIVSHDRLTAATGWTPRRPLDVIVRECLDEGEP